MTKGTGKIRDIDIDTSNLYREEQYTDLKVGTLQKLVPITANGDDDPSRETLFIGQAQIMSQMGPIPISAPIEAKTLAAACAEFPSALEKAMEKLAEEAQKRQIEDASRIVVPGKGPTTGGFTLK